MLTAGVSAPMFCRRTPLYATVPETYVYSIVSHNDSLYCSTRSGTILRFHPEHPGFPVFLGMRRFLPIRTLGFLASGDLLASSYEGGVYRVTDDTLCLLPGMNRSAWAMKIDGNDRLWLAGRQGVFRQKDDTLLRITDLREAHDVDFYRGKLVVAHRNGITMYDSSTGSEEQTWCKDTICWSIDIFDSLLIATGVETCLLVSGSDQTRIRIGPRGNIPWAAVRESTGVIFLATQKGVFRILPGRKTAECIGFSGRCIKSVCIDRSGRLWVGKYFRQ
jgi:hypothetical protein